MKYPVQVWTRNDFERDGIQLWVDADGKWWWFYSKVLSWQRSSIGDGKPETLHFTFLMTHDGQ